MTGSELESLIIKHKQEEAMQTQTNQMPEKQFKALKKAIFDKMQKYEVEEGLNYIEVDNGEDVISIEFFGHIRDEYYGDGINEPRGCDSETVIEMVSIDLNGLICSTAQLMELETEVKLNA